MNLHYLTPCPGCAVRAITSRNGLDGACQNCGHTVSTDGLVVNGNWPPRRSTQQKPAVVYYLRFGDRVKIGTTRNLAARLVAVPHDELLATEPGSYDVEKQRHRQFHGARVYANREWFWLTDEVSAHIASLAAG